jgi:hypothetical protein
MIASPLKLGYIPDICPACKQSCTYVVGLDRGSVDIMKAIARFIGQKGINAVHPRKEMEGTYLTSNQVGNLSRPRMHGLIAHLKGERGNYCLTKKGALFLRGESIPRYAIISKAEGHQVGYFNPETLTCRISEYNESGEPYWEGINYDIEEGRIIQDNQGKLL